MRNYRKKHKTKISKIEHKYYMKTKTDASARNHVNYGNRISKKANATRRLYKEIEQNNGYELKIRNDHEKLTKKRINKRGLTSEEEKILKSIKKR